MTRPQGKRYPFESALVRAPHLRYKLPGRLRRGRPDAVSLQPAERVFRPREADPACAFGSTRAARSMRSFTLLKHPVRRFSVYIRSCAIVTTTSFQNIFFFLIISERNPTPVSRPCPLSPVVGQAGSAPRGAGGSPQCSARAPPTRGSVSCPRPLVQHAREDVNTEGYAARSEFKGGARMKSRPGFTRNFLLSP